MSEYMLQAFNDTRRPSQDMVLGSTPTRNVQVSSTRVKVTYNKKPPYTPSAPYPSQRSFTSDSNPMSGFRNCPKSTPIMMLNNYQGPSPSIPSVSDSKLRVPEAGPSFRKLEKPTKKKIELVEDSKPSVSGSAMFDTSSNSLIARSVKILAQKKQNELTLENLNKLKNGKGIKEGSANSKKLNDIEKSILYEDPNLPEGWKRMIHTSKNSETGEEKPSVVLQSPDGHKFRNRAHITKYLEKGNLDLSPDDFYFGLYPKRETSSSKEEDCTVSSTTDAPKVKKKDKSKVAVAIKETKEMDLKQKIKKLKKLSEACKSQKKKDAYLKKIKFLKGSIIKEKNKNMKAKVESPETVKVEPQKSEKENKENQNVSPVTSEDRATSIYEKTLSKIRCSEEVMFNDPNLPQGWSRIINVRLSGESEGKIDVIIVSPEQKRFKSKGQLAVHLEKRYPELSITQFYFGIYPPGHKRRSTGKNLSKTKVGNGNEDDVDEEKRKEAVKKERSMLHPWDQPMEEDPFIPSGFKRIIKYSDECVEKDRVIILNVESNKKFHAKKSLEEYLIETNSPYKIEEFDFSLCGRLSKQLKVIDNQIEQDEKKKRKEKRAAAALEAASASTSKKEEIQDFSKIKSPTGLLKIKEYSSPIMLDDPSLPTGWKRVLHRREKGDSVGRIDVHIYDPEGRKFNRKGQLEEFLAQNDVGLKIDDFDFTVCGKNARPPPPRPRLSQEFSTPVKKPKYASITSSDRPIPSITYDWKEVPPTAEGVLINKATGLALLSGVTNLRSERRTRISKKDHEIAVKEALEWKQPEQEKTENGVPHSWIKVLSSCRGEIVTLEDEAVSAIASATEQFLKCFAQQGYLQSAKDDNLTYDGLATVVEQSESLSPLDTLIPKRISYKDYQRLRRPTQFTSFT